MKVYGAYSTKQVKVEEAVNPVEPIVEEKKEEPLFTFPTIKPFIDNSIAEDVESEDEIEEEQENGEE